MEADYLVEHYATLQSRVRRRYPGVPVDDVVQQTYCEALRSLPRAGELRKPVAWLWTIAKRVASRHVKRERDPEFRPSAAALTDANTEPWAALAAHEELSLVVGQLGGLKNLGTAIREHYLDGRSCKSIANGTDTSSGAIKNRLYRGRKALREILGEDENG